jgi:glycine/D-amino acid oxidase-like deaminating enzyme
MAALRPATPLRHVLSWQDGYLVPRRDGEVLVGSTSTRNCWDRTVSARSLATLLARAAKMVPALRDAQLVRTWTGLRPMSTIRRPILANLPGFANVTIATGHHRNGILLAPITGKLIGELLLQGETSVPLQPFCYRAR